MSDIDRKIIRTIADHGGSVSLFELMSLLSGTSDSEIQEAVKRLKDKELVKVKESSDDPLITVREKAVEEALKVA